MKNSIHVNLKTKLIVLFFAHMQVIAAQEWLPVGTTWQYLNTVWGKPVGINTYMITGDTTILGKACKVMSKAELACDLRPIAEYLYEENDSLFYYESTINDFRLLYDFSAGPQDVVKIPLWEGISIYDTLHIRIDSIASILYDTVSLTKHYVSYGFNVGDSINYSGILVHRAEIIPHIGNLCNFFYLTESGFCDEIHTCPLLCFLKPGLGELKISANFNCDGTTQLDEAFLSKRIRIYPNPANNSLTIRSDLDNEVNWSIHDGSGNVALKSFVPLKSHADIRIDLTRLKPSFYIIVFIDNYGQVVQIEKLVKID